VQKLLVHSSQRRRGIGRALMTTLEQEAQAIRRNLLFLDTEQGSPAETFYRELGYQLAGVIPNYALNSAGDTYIPSAFFYKLLG
jgi:acetyltransferase